MALLPPRRPNFTTAALLLVVVVSPCRGQPILCTAALPRIAFVLARATPNLLATFGAQDAFDQSFFCHASFFVGEIELVGRQDDGDECLVAPFFSSSLLLLL
jgi:hypothetical protein